MTIPAGSRDPGATTPNAKPRDKPGPPRDDRAAEAAIPPDAGRRASVDRKTGEVHGSGAGAGGGNPGEDYDDGTPGGS